MQWIFFCARTCRIPFLEKDEEIILGKQVQRMMSLLAKKEKLEKKEERVINLSEWAMVVGLSSIELNQVLQQGKVAKNKMINANLPLVVSVAKKYLNRNVEFLDLIQEGSLGLERAVEKFDPTKGYKFSTYGYWWIRQSITRAIAQKSRTIRLPIHVTDNLNKIKKAQRELSVMLGRSATTSEIAAELGITSDKVREYLKVARMPMSLDMQVGHEQDISLSKLIKDPNVAPIDDVDRVLMKDGVRQILAELDSREREVIALGFGLVDGKEWTLGAIGKKLNLSRERVRQARK